MKAHWMSGNLDVITRTLSAKNVEEFVARLPLDGRSQILDLACGTGWSTIPLACRGRIVTGVDMVSRLLAQAHQNAEKEGGSIPFHEGYAESSLTRMRRSTAWSRCLESCFRLFPRWRPLSWRALSNPVLKSDGLSAMANWTEQSFSGQIASIAGRHRESPPDMASPLVWGDETAARERLAPGFKSVRTEVISIELELPMGSVDASNFFREHAGGLQIVLKELAEQGRIALASELEAHWAHANIASDTEHHTIIKNEYLQVTGFRR